MLTAIAALRTCASVEIKHLRDINPLVSSALHDWIHDYGTSAHVPRQRTGALNACGFNHFPNRTLSRDWSSCYENVLYFLDFRQNHRAIIVCRDLRENGCSLYAGANESTRNPQIACTSSFGMSGANAHMLLAPIHMMLEEDAADPSQALHWQRIRFYPTSQPLHLALHVHCTHQGSIDFYSTPVTCPKNGPLLQATVHGHTVLHASMLIEAAFAASHMLDDVLPYAALMKVNMAKQEQNIHKSINVHCDHQDSV